MIVGLADQDNENDEYHAPVPIVDVWQDYAEKSKRYKSQDEMAEALGVTPPIVSWRIRCANFPVSVIQAFLTSDELNERHARELLGINQVNNQWLSTEKVYLEVVEAALKKVAQYNEVIKYVSTVVDSWGDVIFYDGDISHKWDAHAR